MNDWISFALSSNEGLALEISYSSFSFLNSSIVTNDFAVTIYDANFNLIDTSSGNNPEIVTTNNSAAGPGGHGGMIYVHIQRNSGFGIYDIQSGHGLHLVAVEAVAEAPDSQCPIHATMLVSSVQELQFQIS